MGQKSIEEKRLNLNIEKLTLWVLPIFLGVSLYVIIYISSNFEEEVFSFLVPFYFALKCWIITLVVNKYLKNQINKSVSGTLRLASYLRAIIIFIILYMLIYICFKQTLILIGPQDDSIGPKHLLLSFGQAIFLSLIIVSSLYLVETIRDWTRIKIKSEKLLRESAQAHMSSLKLQLNPHFLFNNFNTLHSLISEGNKEASEFLIGLSTLYRNILRYEKEELIKLEEELELVEQFNFILSKRFGKNYTCDIVIDRERYRDYYLPPLSIQMLLENAIKHNEVSDSYPLVCKIWIEENKLHVSNPIRAKDQNQVASGVGLDNLIDRYALINGEEVEIQKSKNFEVRLPLIQLNTYT